MSSKRFLPPSLRFAELRRASQNTLILAYLTLTVSAFSFTMTRLELVPFVPEPIRHFFYGMMAPYQGYKTQNFDLLAEGKLATNEKLKMKNEELLKNEKWEKIDLDLYYPMILGNQIMYRRLRSFHIEGEEISKKKYTELAQLLLQHEQERGHSYKAVRLNWQQWPASAEGHEARREQAINYFLAQTP